MRICIGVNTVKGTNSLHQSVYWLAMKITLFPFTFATRCATNYPFAGFTTVLGWP